jgi:ABC-2 type transport system ATP-binding protein
MRRRLLVAKALVHSPEVLILDEPTAGVDVELRTQLWDYVRQLNAQGTTILLTTHYLQEAQELCDHIAVIQNGELIANDSKQNMMKLIDRKKMTITLAKAVKSVPAALKKFGAVLLDKTTLEISYESAKLSVNDILHALSTATLEVADLSMDEADLEEVFKHLVNKKTA